MTLADVAGRMLATVWQDGGQRRARRNAWAAMAADSRRARDRAEAQALLAEVGALVDSRRGSRIQVEEGRRPGA
jgi:hypothetical protein